MTDDRQKAERDLRRVRWLLEHSTLYAWTVAVVMFVTFAWVAGQSIRLAGLVAALTSGGVWYAWRPAGPIARNWADRIAQADGAGDDFDPDADRPDGPPEAP
jgi:hypothetical protein